MTQEEKWEKRIHLLKERREKTRSVIESQTVQLKKIDDEIQVLETKQNDRLIKSFRSKLQKEGLSVDESTFDKVLSILKTEKSISDVEPGNGEEISSSENDIKETYPNEHIPVIPDAFK